MGPESMGRPPGQPEGEPIRPETEKPPEEEKLERVSVPGAERPEEAGPGLETPKETPPPEDEVEREKIKAGVPVEMPAVKIEGKPEETKEAPKPPSRIKKAGRRLAKAFEAGVKGAKVGWQEKRAEREKQEKERKVEKEIRKIEKEKGKQAAKEARKIKMGGALLMPRVEPEKTKEKRKSWEEMSEEERREKYGRSFEIRERLYQFNKTRTNLVVLENELNSRKSLSGRILEKLHLGGKTPANVLEKQYAEALKNYELARAEYVGAKAWRMLKERSRTAETEAREFVKGDKFETFRRGWRWLGDQNAEKALARIGLKNSFWKFTGRMLSLRTAASLGLLGGSMAIGFGSAAGIGMLAARRVMGGAGTAFGSYDLMKMVTEKKMLTVSKEQFEKMKDPELEEKMAEFEARAKFSGERIVRSKDYDLLRKEYKRRLETDLKAWEKKEAEEALSKRVQYLDTVLRSKGARIAKEEKHRKIAAVGVGLFSIGAFSASDIARIIESEPELTGVTPEAVRDTVKTGPIATPEQLQDSIKAEAAVPDTVLQEAEKVGASAGGAAETQAAETIVGTVKQSGSASQAAWDLVKEEKITAKQLSEAWTSPASMVELPSGAKVHISELGLTHAGDQVVYVAEAGNVPAHFEVIDYAQDKFHVGNNQDLADAFKAEGKKIPRWLQEALGAKTETVKVPPAAEIKVPEETLEQIRKDSAAAVEEALKQTPEEAAAKIVPAEEVAKSAAEGALENAPQELKFDWGTARFVLNKEGRIADIIIQETAAIEKRPALVNRAVQELLQSNYARSLERGVPEATRHLIMPQRIAEAKEAAWEVFRLKQVLESVTDGQSSEAYFLRYKTKLLAVAKEAALGARIFRAFRF